MPWPSELIVVVVVEKERESRVCAIPFVSDLCLLLLPCFVLCAVLDSSGWRGEGGGEISRTGKITTTRRKRKSETTTNDRRRNKERKKEKGKEGNERMAGTERNGTRKAANGKQDNLRRREPDGRTDEGWPSITALVGGGASYFSPSRLSGIKRRRKCKRSWSGVWIVVGSSIRWQLALTDGL